MSPNNYSEQDSILNIHEWTTIMLYSNTFLIIEMISYELICLVILKDYYMKGTLLSHLYLQMKKLRFIKLRNILEYSSVVE